jgi:ribosomal protein S18 acetylase RimI-like enzyme
VTAVRRARPQDVARLEEIATTAYKPYVPRIGKPPAPMTADYAAAVAADDVWVAVAGDVVVGLLILVPAADHLLLENIAVDPRYRGRGIGARLLSVAEERAARAGLAEIRLYTNAAMTENISYYPRHGYVETHRGQGDGFDRVYFSKQLRRS